MKITVPKAFSTQKLQTREMEYMDKYGNFYNTPTRTHKQQADKKLLNKK